MSMKIVVASVRSCTWFCEWIVA